jgi:hypothetical protein
MMYVHSRLTIFVKVISDTKLDRTVYVVSYSLI